ncbi:MAG: ABC transporter substrate-binding protein [Salegentibacter sp.]
MKRFGFLIILLILTACRNEQKNSAAAKLSSGEEVEVEYANGFSITKYEDFSILTVKSPWPKADRNFRYLLTEKGAHIPENLEYDQKIEVPVQKIVVTSTTHIPALEALDEENRLVGFPGLNYISSEKTRHLIKKGQIKELGKNEDLNTEVLLNLQPDVVIGFAIDGNNKTFNTIQKAGIPVAYNGDWTEEDPLGKAEWIKFFGAFFGKLDQAKEIFRNIETDYNQAKKLAKTAEDSPKVLSGSMYKDQWYLPYGNSWQARFIKDANGTYIYADSEGNGSMALSFEGVLSKAQDADFWISAGQFTSYGQLLNESEHYSQFKAVQERNVYSVSLTKGETGGVLYYELGPQRPDLVLKDLISIFHSQLLPNYQRTFFKALKE